MIHPLEQENNSTEVITIYQLLMRKKRHGEPIMPLLMEYFDHELLELYSVFEQIHQDEYSELFEDNAYEEFIELKDAKILEPSVTFDDFYTPGDIPDGFQLQILQSLLAQMQDAEKSKKYNWLKRLVDTIIENVNKCEKVVHENGDMTLIYADGEIAEFEIIKAPGENPEKSENE